MTIKRRPSDFKVTEILADAVRRGIRQERAAFALYKLEKQSLTTPDAIAMVAKKLTAPVASIAYAGLKDRHAATRQHITIRCREADLAQRASGHNWKVERLGWLDEELSAKSIEGNHFEIMIRGLSRRIMKRMDDAAAALTVRAGTLRIVNYFGAQRFGSARHGKGFAAKYLIAGDFETALKLLMGTPSRKDSSRDSQFKRTIAERWGRWNELLPKLGRRLERAVIEHLATAPDDFREAFAKLPYFTQQIAVEAYQSHLWNQIAREVVRAHAGPGPVIRADDPFGAMLFPPAASVDHKLAELEVPLLGRYSQLSELWKPAAEMVLDREGITTANLRIPGLKRPFFGEAPRRLFIEAMSLALGNPQKDEDDRSGKRFRRRLVMDLPRGAYATVVLRALGQ